MEYRIIKLKKDYVMRDLDMVDTEVKAGTRVLVEVYEDNSNLCICFKELSKDELKEQLDGNECFTYIETIKTRKGTTVEMYRDMETLETFFYCKSRIGGSNV